MGLKRKSSSRLRSLFSAHSVISVNSVLKSPFAASRSQIRKKPLSFATLLLCSTTLVIAAQAQEKTPPMHMNQQMQHHHGDVPLVKPEYPRMGRSQENATAPLVTLEQVEKMASETNPTLRQAEAEIRAAKARQQQVGLYPNPSVGYTGDEIRGGSVGGGKQGFFVQQTIVTAGKLGRSREVSGAESKLAEIEAQEQQTRVTTAVKIVKA